MTGSLRIRSLEIHTLAIPLRLRFEHAAAARSASDPVLVRLQAEAPFMRCAGFGETLARSYVTGETQETVIEDLSRFFAPHLLDFRPDSFEAAVDFIDQLPARFDGRLVNAARAAIELALLDLTCKAFERPIAAAAALRLPSNEFGPPGCVDRARYSGQVVGRSRSKLAAVLRAQRCYGLRDFKLKVATPGWESRLQNAHRVLRGALRRGQASLRVDANAGWTLSEAMHAAPLLERCGVCALEQPLPVGDDALLRELAASLRCDLIADESLRTIDDAQRLITGGAVRVFNVRIAKNGGLLASLKIAQVALEAGLDLQLGCLVGETSLLTAAGVRFLELCPTVRFVEGGFGRWLLRRDVLAQPLGFGRGGRIGRLSDAGLGIDPDPERLRDLAAREATCIHY